MMFKKSLHRCADLNRLFRVTHQVTDQPDAATFRQFHQHDNVRALIFEGRMNGMPYPFVTVYVARGADLFKINVVAMAAKTYPFRTPLKLLT